MAGLGDPPADRLGFGCLRDVVDLDALASGSTARGAAEGRVVRREEPIAGLEGSERYEESIYTISVNYLLLSRQPFINMPPKHFFPYSASSLVFFALLVVYSVQVHIK